MEPVSVFEVFSEAFFLLISYGEDILHNGEVYRAIIGEEVDGEAFIRYLQPRDDPLPAQEAHDEALDYLFEQEEDLKVVKTELSPGEGGLPDT